MSYSTTPGSATSSDPSDFESVTGEVILSSTATVVTFAIPIVNDDILEDSESFVVTLRKADGRDTLRLLQSEATVTILDDNDPVTIGFGSSLYSVREDQSAVLDVGVLSGGLERDITVSYDIRGGSAVAGVDYEYMTGTVTLSSDASETLSISLLEDNIFDPGETFTVVLTGHTGPSSVMLGLSEAVVRIDEDDSRPTVDLEEIVDVSEGETVTVIARLSGALSVPVELTLGPLDADYAITVSRAVILAGDLTVAFELIAINDNLFEGVEEKTVELGVSDNVVGLGDRVQSFKILDAQSRSSLSLDPVVAIEEGDDRIVTVRLNRALESTLTVTVSTIEAIGLTRATNAIDYRLSSDSIRIPVGAKFATFTIEVFEDADYEGDEEFRLFLTPVGDLVDLGTLTRTVTILDNDLVTVGFENVEYAVVEGGLSVTVVIVADRLAVRDDITLGYRTVDGSARVSGSDYVGSAGEIVLSAGTTSTTIEIFINEDAAYEYDEEFRVVLSAPAAGLADFVLISGAVTSVTIENDDKVTVGFEESVYRVSESVGALELPVVVLGGSIGDDTEIEVRYSVIAGTAEAGSDYEIVNGMLTLSSSMTSAIEVLITDDSAYEYDETFTVVLDTTLVGVMLTAAVTDVTIEDDDTVEIGFERAMYVVDEDSGEVELTVAVLNGSLGDTITLNYVTADGTAVAGEDYTAVSSSLTLSSDMNSATFMVTISDDVLFETDELFRVSLSGAPVRVALNLSSAEVTIVNDDTVEFGFESATYSVSEGSGTVELTVEVISGVLAQSVTLSYATVDGSAVVGTDYRSEMPTLTLLAGSTSVTFTIDIFDDVSPESDETFTVVLSSASVGVSFNPTSAIVTITDDDEAPVVPELPEVVVVTATLRVSELSVSEGDTATLNIELSEPASEDVTLTLTVVAGGSAVESVDYEPLLVPVVIRAGLSELTVSIRTIDDDVSEETETFELVLSVLSGPAVTGTVDSVTVTITDDDEAPVVPELPEVVVVTATLRVSELSVSEGATTTLYIELSDPTSEDVTVTLSVVLSGSTAEEGTDYRLLPLAPYVLTAGETELAVGISTVVDGIYEFTETIEFVILTLSGPAVTGAVDRVTVTITDDDPVPTVSLELSSESVTEGSVVTVSAELSGAYPAPVEVLFEIVGVSVDLTDYSTPSSLRVTIPAGDTLVSFVLTATVDGLYEVMSETLELRLRVPSNAVQVTGGVQTLTIVDTDSEPTVSLEPVNPSVKEGDSVVVDAVLSGAQVDAVEVLLELTDVTASGSDYITPTTLLGTIPAGETRVSFELTATVDGIYEGVADETLTLSLRVPSGAIQVSGGVQTLTIIDSDLVPTVSLVLSSDSVLEGTGVMVSAELVGAFAEDVEVLLEVVDGTAEFADYMTPSTLRVPLLAGSTSVAYVLTAAVDGLYEGSEAETLELRVRVFGGGDFISSSTQTLRILDVDKVTIGFQETTYRIEEDQDAVLTVAVLIGRLAPGVELSLTYETRDDSAYASTDYTTTVGTLLLSSVSLSQQITIPVIDDVISELEERLTVELTAVTTSDRRVAVAPSVSEILIGDNDPVAGFQIVPIVPVTEGETFTVEVVLDSVSASTVTVTLEDALSGTSKAGDDYSLPGILTGDDSGWRSDSYVQNNHAIGRSIRGR